MPSESMRRISVSTSSRLLNAMGRSLATRGRVSDMWCMLVLVGRTHGEQKGRSVWSSIVDMAEPVSTIAVTGTKLCSSTSVAWTCISGGVICTTLTLMHLIGFFSCLLRHTLLKWCRRWQWEHVLVERGTAAVLMTVWRLATVHARLGHGVWRRCVLLTNSSNVDALVAHGCWGRVSRLVRLHNLNEAVQVNCCFSEEFFLSVAVVAP